jgi:2-keto-4-pentenoate hydratase/2-oxohepta-3-ene-1,7-dioic acid hydratase in catechol pathway
MLPKYSISIVRHGATIEIPKIAQDNQATYKGELMTVIGKDAKNVSEADISDYIVGYAVGNDVLARYVSFLPVIL